jgi:hypothetical protein
MYEARFAFSSIAKPGAIAPTPASRQGHWFPLVSGNSVVLLCRLTVLRRLAEIAAGSKHVPRPR